ncbi:MAG: beta-propeller domain-containing protein, partial [Stackebrandtia sp.]
TPRSTRAAAAVCAATLLAAGCAASGDASGQLERDAEAPRLSGALTTFDSCDEALTELRENAVKHVDATDQFETGEDGADAPQGEEEERSSAEDSSGEQGATEHSETNVQEAGIDEPDVVKTDGERILALSQGSLHVVDAESAQISGSLSLVEEDYYGWAEMLWHEDRALIIMDSAQMYAPEVWEDESGYAPSELTIVLVDVSGKPEVLNTFAIEGAHVDSRAVENMSRVVVRSEPHVEVPEYRDGDDPAEAARDAIEDSKIEDWLPRYVSDGDEGQIPCAAVARPEVYSGTSMLTVLSFDMLGELGDGSPVTVAADGGVVYGSADSLYVANDRSAFADGDDAESTGEETELYRFALDSHGPPQFESSAAVPGFLLNQYAMSERDGYLRVATTSQPAWQEAEDGATSSSALYVLDVNDDLEQVGSVDGLGPDERIYAVRYVDDSAYVVTFRETDPLYTLDLSDPKNPKVEGELKITGFSSYLHPVSFERLVGVGQEATEEGVTTGAQVSLFDVSDASDPARLDQHHMPDSWSNAEYDPHAFLYWPDRSLLVLPVSGYEGDGGVLLLTVGDDTIEETGTLSHDAEAGAWTSISRSMIVGDTLWTMSEAGLLAADLDDLDDTEWLPFA